MTERPSVETEMRELAHDLDCAIAATIRAFNRSLWLLGVSAADIPALLDDERVRQAKFKQTVLGQCREAVLRHSGQELH